MFFFFLNNQLAKCDRRKDYWSVLRHILGKKATNACSQLLVDGNLISDENEIAEALNNFFIEVGLNISRNCGTDREFLVFLHPVINSENNNHFTTFRLSSLKEIKCIN